MLFTATDLDGVFIVEPKVHKDQRGFFMETYRKDIFIRNGINVDFVQFNHSLSVKNTLRGLHYHLGKTQAKLVRVIAGAVFDVVVDIREGSPTYGHHFSIELNDENHLQLWIPPGFAHGFSVLSDFAYFSYKCTNIYHRDSEDGLMYNDLDLNIDWEVENPIISEKDLQLQSFKNFKSKFKI